MINDNNNAWQRRHNIYIYIYIYIICEGSALYLFSIEMIDAYRNSTHYTDLLMPIGTGQY